MYVLLYSTQIKTHLVLQEWILKIVNVSLHMMCFIPSASFGCSISGSFLFLFSCHAMQHKHHLNHEQERSFNAHLLRVDFQIQQRLYVYLFKLINMCFSIGFVCHLQCFAFNFLDISFFVILCDVSVSGNVLCCVFKLISN